MQKEKAAMAASTFTSAFVSFELLADMLKTSNKGSEKFTNCIYWSKYDQVMNVKNNGHYDITNSKSLFFHMVLKKLMWLKPISDHKGI